MGPPPQFISILVVPLDRAQLEAFLIIILDFSILKFSSGKPMKNQTRKKVLQNFTKWFRKFSLGVTRVFLGIQQLTDWCRKQEFYAPGEIALMQIFLILQTFKNGVSLRQKWGKNGTKFCPISFNNI